MNGVKLRRAVAAVYDRRRAALPKLTALTERRYSSFVN
jgi:hypothetical protein